MHRFLRTLTVSALCVLPFVACDSGTDPPGRPVLIGAASPAGPGQFDSSRLIFVVPVDGMNGAGSLVLADAIAAALRDAEKPAVLAEAVNETGPTIIGRITTVEERDSVVWVTAAWALKAPYGTAVAEYRHQIVVDKMLWAKGAAEAINLLAADAGPSISAMVRDYISPMALAPVPPRPQPAQLAAQSTEPSAVPVATSSAAGPFYPGNPPARAPAPPDPAPVRVSPPAMAQPLVAPPPQAAAPPERPAAVAVKADPAPPVVAETPPKALIRKPVPRARPKKETTPAPTRKREQAALAQPKATPAPKPAAAAKPEKVLMPIPEETPAPKTKSRPTAKSKPEKVLMPVPDAGPSQIIPDPPPVKWGRPAFLIKVVEGAPGDGNLALTTAMKSALRTRDLTVTEDPRQAGFVIVGKVELSAPVDGRQHAKIVWAVNTITGDEVGKAVQENAVKAGSLDGPWGRVADIVSNAAAVGIQELFGIEERQSSRAQPLPDFSVHRNLPQVPGRAMPPPK